MPRRRQRFSKLDAALKLAHGNPTPGSPLAYYKDFKDGKTKIDVKVVLTAAERQRFGFAILPFNKAVSDPVVPSDRYAAPITALSDAGRKSLALIDTQLGYATIDEFTEQSAGFYPAVLRVFVPTGTEVTTPVSAVTKEEYRRRPGRNYGIPFGRTTAGSKTDTEEGRRAALTADAKKGTPTVKATSVSYEPEIFKTGKPKLQSPP